MPKISLLVGEKFDRVKTPVAVAACTSLEFVLQQNDSIEKANANVHLVNNDGHTALSCALVFNNLSAAALLVAHGALPDLAQHEPNSPTREALERGLALREQVAQYNQARQAAVLAELAEEGVPEDYGATCAVELGLELGQARRCSNLMSHTQHPWR